MAIWRSVRPLSNASKSPSRWSAFSSRRWAPAKVAQDRELKNQKRT